MIVVLFVLAQVNNAVSFMCTNTDVVTKECNWNGICVNGNCDCEYDYYGSQCEKERYLHWKFSYGRETPNLSPVYPPVYYLYDGSIFPGQRFFHSGVVMNEDLYIFGGSRWKNKFDYDSQLEIHKYNDIWSYNIRLRKWRMISGPYTYDDPGSYPHDIGSSGWPSARSMARLVSWEENNELVLYGGETYGNICSNEIWSYDLTRNVFYWIGGEFPHNSTPVYNSFNYDSINKPGSRYSHTFEMMSPEEAVIFGGNQGEFLLSSMFLWNRAQFSWVNGGNNNYGVYVIGPIQPGAREKHSSAILDNKLYIFGGFGLGNTSIGSLNDLWSFNFVDKQWKFLSGETDPSDDMISNELDKYSLENHPPGSDSSNRLVVFKGNLLLFGGVDRTEYYDYLGFFEPRFSKGGQWKFKKDVFFSNQFDRNIDDFYSPQNWPGSSAGHVVANVKDEMLVLFGGCGYSIHSETPVGLNSVWVYGQDFWAQCHGIYKNNSDVCHGHGECVEDNRCICEESWSPSTVDCAPICFNESDVDFVCSGHGSCVTPSNCSCDEHYRGDSCDVFECFNILNSNEDVCSGHGICINYDECSCHWDFSGQRCSNPRWQAWKRLKYVIRNNGSEDALNNPPIYPDVPPFVDDTRRNTHPFPLSYSDGIHPGGRMYHCGVSVGKKYYIMFGGEGGMNEPRNDLWRLDVEERKWRFIGGTVDDNGDGQYYSVGDPAIPAGRIGGGLVVWEDQALETGYYSLVLFGGMNRLHPSTLLNDLLVFYHYDDTIYESNFFLYLGGEYSQEVPMVKHVHEFSNLNQVGSRAFHTITKISNDEFAVFGGEIVGRSTKSLFIISPSLFPMTKWEGGSDGDPRYVGKGSYDVRAIPWQRSSHSAYFMEKTDELYICFGVVDNTIPVNDLWSYSFRLKMWRYVAGNGLNNTEIRDDLYNEYSPDGLPYGRFSHGPSLLGMGRNNLELVIYGGLSYASSPPSPQYVLSDFWFFHTVLQQWKFVGPEGIQGETLFDFPGNLQINKREFTLKNYPGSILSHTMVRLNDEMILIHGGYGRSSDQSTVNQGYLSTVWIYGQDKWAECYNRSGNEVCFGHGECVQPNDCHCDLNWNQTEYCRHTKLTCDNKEFYDPQVCNVHGDCIGVDNCTCHGDYYGQNCQEWDCYNVNHNGPGVCNDRGNCIEPDVCVCTTGRFYFGDMCDQYLCNGILKDSPDVCSGGHGDCIAPNDCRCLRDPISNATLYKSRYCTKPVCFGYGKGEDLVCSQHGECQAPQDCDCMKDYFSESCLELIRDPIYSYTDKIGRLVQFSYYLQSSNFPTHNTDMLHGEPFMCSRVIQEWDRIGYLNSSYCHFSFVEILGIKISETLHIIFYDPHSETKEAVDDWASRFVGENVSLSIKPLTSPQRAVPFHVLLTERPPNPGTGQEVMKGGESTADLTFLWILFLVIGVFLFLMFCLCMLCILGSLLLVFSSVFVIGGGGLFSLYVYSQQKQRLRKFKQLDNFELLLKEQLLEKDHSTPLIKINQSLFEINFDELELIEVLGAGGSDATVYKCSWRGKHVAFKSFKTRQICQRQSDYEAFESEANLLSSVSHPNIIQYFGCVLKPPRLGFIMEYCDHGDLWKYVSVQKQEGVKIPYHEKLRMCIEISSGLGYLHSRKVIHRDVKLENVLVDENLSMKIMDFGISRMIEKTTQIKTKKVGTSVFMSPEVCQGSKYNEKCDVFGFAILCWILYFEDNNPYGEESGGLYIENRVANDPFYRPSFKDHVDPHRLEHQSMPKYFKYMMIRCWDDDSKNRDSFDTICASFGDEYRKLMTKIRKGKEFLDKMNIGGSEDVYIDHSIIRKIKKKKKEKVDRTQFDSFIEMEVVSEEEDDDDDEEEVMLLNNSEEDDLQSTNTGKLVEIIEKLKNENKQLKKKLNGYV